MVGRAEGLVFLAFPRFEETASLEFNRRRSIDSETENLLQTWGGAPPKLTTSRTVRSAFWSVHNQQKHELKRTKKKGIDPCKISCCASISSTSSLAGMRTPIGKPPLPEFRPS